MSSTLDGVATVSHHAHHRAPPPSPEERRSASRPPVRTLRPQLDSTPPTLHCSRVRPRCTATPSPQGMSPPLTPRSAETELASRRPRARPLASSRLTSRSRAGALSVGHTPLFDGEACLSDSGGVRQRGETLTTGAGDRHQRPGPRSPDGVTTTDATTRCPCERLARLGRGGRPPLRSAPRVPHRSPASCPEARRWHRNDTNITQARLRLMTLDIACSRARTRP